MVGLLQVLLLCLTIAIDDRHLDGTVTSNKLDNFQIIELYCFLLLVIFNRVEFSLGA